MTQFDINQIQKILPHRYPFLMIDRVVEVEPGKTLTAIKNVSRNEPFFEGHFPQSPIVPGVILIEALAQTAGVVVSKGFLNNENKSVLFMSISSAKFRKPVIPNDEISFNVHFLNNVKSVYKFQGEANNGKVKVCEAVFSAMIINKEYKEII